MVSIPKSDIKDSLRQNENFKEKVLTEEERYRDLLKCQMSLHYFLQEKVYILNRNTGKKVKWQPWEYQLDLLDIFLNFKEIVLLKARQLGWTWLLTAYALWKSQFTEAAKVLLCSQGEKEAFDLISKCKYILKNEPDYLIAPQLHPDNKATLDYKTHESLVEAVSSAAAKGRSTDATVVIRDELAQHPYGAESLSSLGATIDSGGQLIDCSTIDKTDPTNHFTERVLGAYEGSTRTDLKSGLSVFTGGSNGAILVFGGWRLRPIREPGLNLDDWFKKRVMPKYKPLVIEQEYPEDIETALREPQSIAFFDKEMLDEMELGCLVPLHARAIDSEYVYTYMMPQVGQRYIVFTDPSDGYVDPFHTVVVNAKTGVGVCEATGLVPAEEAAQVHHDLCLKYNKAYNSYEANGAAGAKFAMAIKELNTPNQAPRRTADGEIQRDINSKSKTGWLAWGNRYGSSRETSLLNLEEACRKRTVTVLRKETIAQFREMMRADDKIDVRGEGHDDAILAWAGAVAIRKYAPTGDMRITSWAR